MRKYLDGTLHFSYRGQGLKYEDLGECRPPKEQTNSVKVAAEKKAAISPKQKCAPPADHPWRKFQFGRRTTEQKAPPAVAPDNSRESLINVPLSSSNVVDGEAAFIALNGVAGLTK